MVDRDKEANDQDAWLEELIRRNGEIEAGRAVGIPAEQVFNALREKFTGTSSKLQPHSKDTPK